MTWLTFKRDPHAMNRYEMKLPPVQMEMFQNKCSFIYPALRNQGNPAERSKQ